MGAGGRDRSGLSPEDRRLLGELVADMGPRLFAYVRHMAHPQDAEDIVAETFCRAAANMAAVRATDRRDLYFLTIARNLCRDRRRRRTPASLPPERLDGRMDAAPGALTELLDQEQHARMRAAVAELPDSLREIVVLRLSTRLKFEEIAELLHVPLGTALSRMHAGVQQLRTKLDLVHEQR